jgi:hypothetical protein
LNNYIASSLAKLKSDYCIIIEQSLALRTKKTGWLIINATLSLLQDRAILAEIIREWAIESDWKIWHTPVVKEHSIVIDTGEHLYSTIHKSYTEALFQTYISATKGIKNVSI